MGVCAISLSHSSFLSRCPGMTKILFTESIMLLCWCLTSHQQLRSYGDVATAYSLIRQTCKAGN